MRFIFSLPVCLLSCALLSGCALTPTASDSATVQGAAIHGVSMGGRTPISGQKVYLLEASLTGYYGSGSYTQSTVNSSLNTPGQVAIDSAGNLYVADAGNSEVKEFTKASGYATVNVLGSGFTTPAGVAVDISGNVYVSDSGANTIFKIPAGNGTVQTLVSSGLSGPRQLVVDSSSNIFVTDYGHNNIKEFTAASTYATAVQLAPTFTFNNPIGLALDSAGDVFVGNSGGPTVVEITAGSGYSTASTLGGTFTFSAPRGLTVDGSGNVYVVDATTNDVYEIVAAGGGYTTVNTLVTGLSTPAGVARDAYGNLFVGNSIASGSLVEEAVTGSGHGASKSLLTSATGYGPDSIGYYVLSDANGNWSIGGDYTCDANSQVYVYGLGGNSGAGGNNTGIGLMAALGQCPASSPYNFATADPFITMNEVTTVAAAYAMAGYATDATHVSANNTTLGIQGLANAFANAGSLVTVSTGTANSSVPNVTGSTVPQQEINTLGNILAACVNSLTGSTSCTTTLFPNAESGGSSGTAPTDTATAAINIAHNPSNAISTLFGLQTGLGSAPYPTDLSSAPNDFTVGVLFTGGGLLGTQESQGAHQAAIDGSGNLWIANYYNNSLVEFSPSGVPTSSTGYALGANTKPASVAVDAASANVWVAENGSSASNGAAVKFNIGASAVQATYNCYSANCSSSEYYEDVELDGSGNAWACKAGTPTLVFKLSSSAALIGTGTNAADGINGTSSLAIQPGAAGNVWVINNAATYRANVFTNNNSSSLTDTGDTYGSPSSPYAAAIDASGNVWITNTGTNSVTKMAANLASGSNYALGSHKKLDAVAIDGAGNVWVTDYSGTLWKLNNSGTNISGTTGFVPPNAGKPDALAIDGSGNVWYTEYSAGIVHELIGAAAPVVTPIAYGVANSQLGTVP